VSKKHIRVSIVIPAFNEQNHLEKCLQAIARQTVRPYEVIVVDNNSTDATAEVAQAFPFVTVIRESEQGIVFARNAGFNVAKGDVLARIDADAEIPPDWVKHICGFYAEAAHHQVVWTGGVYFSNTRFPRLVSGIFNFVTFYYNRLLFGHFPICGSNTALLRSQWQVVCGTVHNQTDNHEDLDLAVHMHQAGYQIFYDRKIKVRAVLRRVYSHTDQLWGHLQCWPHTLKLHHRPAWPCLPALIFFYYVLRPILVITDRCKRLFRN